MAEPFIGQLALLAIGYAPQKWVPCDGRLLSVRDNEPLFSLIGTTFGGDGQSNFAVPDLRGRAAVSMGGSLNLQWGNQVGTEFHTLTANEIPSHSHALCGTTTSADSGVPTGKLPGAPTAANEIYIPDAGLATVNMAGNSIGGGGEGQAHENRHPFLALTWCIATSGYYPIRPE